MLQAKTDRNPTLNSLARHWVSALGLLLIILGFLAFANTFPGAFINDDIPIVSRNPLVNSLDLSAIFTTDYWGVEAKQAVLFRPVTILSLALNQRLLGSSAWSFHLVNVILHALVGLAFFLLLLRWEISPPLAFFAAALFALHPLHGEAVNVIVGRSELLAALFFMLALIFSASPGVWRLAAVPIFFVLAVLAKESAVTFLAALLFSDLYFRREIRKRLPLYGVLLAVTVIWLLYRKFGLVNGMRVPSEFSREDAAIFQPLQLLSTPVRILTALKIQIYYLGTLLLPLQLQTIYSGPGVAEPVTSLGTVWGAVICAVGGLMTGLSVYGWRRRQLFGLTIPLYAVSSVVTANIFFVSGVIMAERSAYLPSVWFCITLPSLLAAPNWGHERYRRALWGGLSLLLLVSFVLTWGRNYDFRDPVSLWSSGFARDRRNTVAGIFLADAYIQNHEREKALEIGAQLLDNNPDSRKLLELQAHLLLDVGRPAEALGYLERAIRTMGDSPSFELLTTTVAINARLGRPAEALKWLERIDPSRRDGNYWKYRGNAYAELGDYAQALSCYRQVVGDSPQAAEVRPLIEKYLRKLGGGIHP